MASPQPATGQPPSRPASCFALLDADDVWLPGRIAALTAAAAARPDLAVLTTDAVESRDGVRTPGTYYGTRPFAVDHQEVAILRENFIFGAGAVRADAFRAVGGYRQARAMPRTGTYGCACCSTANAPASSSSRSMSTAVARRV